MQDTTFSFQVVFTCSVADAIYQYAVNRRWYMERVPEAMQG